MSKKRIIIISVIVCLIIIGGTVGFYPLRVLYIKTNGVALKPSRVIAPAAVTYYLQNDPRWSADKIGASSSAMGGTGCLIASIATALDYYGIKYTPGQLNKIFTDNGVLDGSGQVIWMNIKNAVPSIDYKYSRVFDSGTIANLLDNNLLPIIEVKYKGFGFGVYHWVVVIGSDGKDFLIMDPLNQSKTPIKLSEHGGRALAYRVLAKT